MAEAFPTSSSEDDKLLGVTESYAESKNIKGELSKLQDIEQRGHVCSHVYVDFLTGKTTDSLKEKIGQSQAGLYYFKRGVIPDSLKDFLQNKLMKHLDERFEYKILESGSQAEGVKLPLFQNLQKRSFLFEYEYDIMLCIKGLKIPFAEVDTKLVFDSQGEDQIPPGFCWVCLDEDQQFLWKDCCILIKKPDTTFHCLSPRLIREKLFKSMSYAVEKFGWWEDFKLSLSQQGPAVTLIMTKHVSQACHDCGNELAPKYAQQISIVYNLDVVLAIQCEKWPMAAEEWKLRGRQWPPPSLVQSIIDEGCHVVPKSSIDGNEDLEWRLSFSLAELRLSNQLSRDLPQVMYSWYITKTLLSNYLITEPKILSSYHVKTLIFWLAERISFECIAENDNYEDFMRKQNFVPVVLSLLDELMYRLVSGNFPNYFIPQCNMSSAHSSEIILSLCKKLTDIRFNIVPHLNFKK